MNKWKITAYMCVLCTLFSLSGCGGSSQMYLDAKVQEQSAGHDPASKEDVEENMLEASDSSSLKEDAGETCFVYICGAVKHPGVFEVPSGSRIYEVISLAGGLKKNASVKGINQAQQVADGDMIEILTIKEQQETAQESVAAAETPNAGDGRIDINTASASELMTLSGIGEAKAANIIAYRESNGRFSAIEELMNVSGIGAGVYAKIQDNITVSK